MRRDLGITAALAGQVPETIVAVFGIVTNLGGLPVVIAVLFALYLRSIVSGLVRDRRPICSPSIAFIIAATFGGLALVLVLKSVLAMPRPPSELAVVPRSGYGFPSGHTMAATVLWGGLARWTTYSTKRRRFLIAGIIIASVAVSRLVLGLHYAVDVGVSIVFGLLYIVLIEKITGRRPTPTFLIAIGIAILALIVTQLHTDAILAITGTVGGFLGWRFVEWIGPRLTRTA